jgi:hypothetical protein
MSVQPDIVNAVMFTAVHRALGVDPQPLTWDMLARAVSEGVTEQPDLDWKSEGYGSPRNEWDELAKDVAAMANSGGGLIVMGVRDQHETAAALRLETPVTLSDPEENAYRREIFARTHPPVQGVSFWRLRGLRDEEQTVAIHVPASLDAPHLIYKDRQRMLFAAPFRDGTGTHWMAERQIEAAYRLRFAARTERERDLQRLYDDASSAFDPRLRACIVAVAKPDQPRPPTLGRLSREQAQSILEDGLARARSFLTGGDTVSALTDVDLLNPRPGLRRLSARSYSEPDELGRQAALVSVHDDGSLSLAWAVGGYHRELPNVVPTFMLERMAVDIVSLVGAASRSLSMYSSYDIELGVTDAGSDIGLLSPGWGGTYENAVTATVRRFQPVRLSVPPQPPDDVLLAAAGDLALDCVSQAGIAKLGVVRPVRS